MVRATAVPISAASSPERPRAGGGAGDAAAVSSAAPSARDVAGWPVAFRGSAAVRAGLVTPGQLRGPAYLRLFPDTYVRRTAEPPELALRSYAAHLYSGRRGILSGYSAADRLGAACHPPEAPAELTVRRGDLRSRAGLLVHRDRLRRDEYEVRLRRPGDHRCALCLRPGPLVAAGRGGGGGRRAGPPRPVPPVGRVAGGRPVPGSTRPRAAAPGGRAGRPRGPGRRWRPGCGWCWCCAGCRCPRPSTRCRTSADGVRCGSISPTRTAGSASSTRARSTPARNGCCATSGATPGWWTGAGASTASPSTRSTANRTRSRRRSGGRSGAR